MRVFALWFGGANYSQPYLENHLEEFPSIAAAREAFTERRYSTGSVSFYYVNADEKDTQETYTPCVDESSEMWLYFYDPTDAHDPYPDRRLYWGPRGGLQEAPC